MKTRDNTYFNDYDEFLFDSSTGHFVSRMHFHKGNWYTNRNPQYKGTSLNCVNIKLINEI